MPHNQNPLVSIVVPCLNRAHYLKSTVDSILQQDYPNIECIVIDGGSTDGTIQILESYGDQIKWISEPDDGHADAINKGWWMSKGKILAWLNADDLYVIPDAISKAVAFLQENPHVDVVYGDCYQIYPDGTVAPNITRPQEWDLEFAVKYCTFIIHQPSSFMRRSILEKVGWLDPDFVNCKDHELWLRIGLVGTIQYAPIIFSYGRIDKGLSQRSDIGAAKVACNRKFFSLPNLPPHFTLEKFKNQAISNAYLVGGYYNYLATERILQYLSYILRAFIVDPLNCVTLPRKFFSDNVYSIIYLIIKKMFWPKKLLIKFLVFPLWIGLVCLFLWLFQRRYGYEATIFFYIFVLILSITYTLFRFFKQIKFYCFNKYMDTFSKSKKT